MSALAFRADDLRAVATAVLLSFGSEPAEAEVVAEHLVGANLKGHDSHGVGLLASYLDDLRAGSLVPNTPLVTVRDAGPVLQFDAGYGFGQRAAREAMDAAADRARANGIALVTVRHSHHLGRIGTYGEQLAAAGLVSFHFVNVLGVPPLVAPFGGSEGRFGTNPVCIALPGTDAAEPIVMDWATSMVAFGKARVAFHAHTQFDDEVLVAPDGTPTRDPSVMFTQPQGALLPFAGHKGGALIYVTELIAGILSGGGTLGADEGPRGLVNNMVSVVIDPAVVGDEHWREEQLRIMTEYTASARQADPVGNPVIAPGEIERRRAAHRSAAGVEISAEEWAGIRAAGVAGGVAESIFADAEARAAASVDFPS